MTRNRSNQFESIDTKEKYESLVIDGMYKRRNEYDDFCVATTYEALVEDFNNVIDGQSTFTDVLMFADVEVSDVEFVDFEQRLHKEVENDEVGRDTAVNVLVEDIMSRELYEDITEIPEYDKLKSMYEDLEDMKRMILINSDTDYVPSNLSKDTMDLITEQYDFLANEMGDLAELYGFILEDVLDHFSK